MNLFHCTHLKLNIGDIIQPGNWGKMIRQIGEAHDSWNREMVLEEARIRYYPSKPSRLNCTFFCDSIETIKCYKEKNCPQGYIYQIELLDQSASMHKGDFNAIEPLPRRSESMIEIAILYWRYGLKTSVAEWPGVECSEVLSTSPIKIAKIIE